MVIQVSKIWTRWMFVVPTILVSISITKAIISTKVCVLLISKCSASSPMLPIDSNGWGLTRTAIQIHKFNLWLTTRIDNSSIWGCINRGYTTEGIVFFLQTSPSKSVDLFHFFSIPKSCVFLKVVNKIEIEKICKLMIKSHHLCNR